MGEFGGEIIRSKLRRWVETVVSDLVENGDLGIGDSDKGFLKSNLDRETVER